MWRCSTLRCGCWWGGRRRYEAPPPGADWRCHFSTSGKGNTLSNSSQLTESNVLFFCSVDVKNNAMLPIATSACFTSCGYCTNKDVHMWHLRRTTINMTSLLTMHVHGYNISFHLATQVTMQCIAMHCNAMNVIVDLEEKLKLNQLIK